MSETPTTKKYYVYCLTNTTNGKKYVGFSYQPKIRWSQHRTRSKLENAEYDTLLNKALRKYGWECFTQEILEVCDDQISGLAAEIKWIALLRTNVRGVGYNMDAGGGVPPDHTGKKRTPEHIAIIKQTHTGKTISDEHKRKVGEASKGRGHTDEAKTRLSVFQTGQTRSDETRSRMSASKKGVRFSEAHRAALSKSKKEKYAAGLVPANKGITGVRTHSEETKKKMSQTHRERLNNSKPEGEQ